MTSNRDQIPNFYNQGYLGFRGVDDEIKARGNRQLGGFPISNFNNRFDVGICQLKQIIDEDDPRLVKIRAKISEEDANYLKGLANKRFGVNNTGFAKMNGRTAKSVGPRFLDNNVGTISMCVIL
ncbi:unnamed protein product [Prunus armeniaca]|uniref:Uncharacterized protein n=1 Tax=Prunus armeniaca TaxID=36596 RepID=A0A6J5VV25_PRUAR|nr:unnamed protein product [Prunus armeniaca]